MITMLKRKHKNCLLIKGTKQIGKSFIIREFGKTNYKSIIETNFYQHPEYKHIYKGDLNVNQIIKKISIAIPNIKSFDYNTLIFLDEIQHFPNARTAIKFLTIDDRYDIISSSSLLDLHYKDIISIPVGYKTQIEMFSLDFKKFFGISIR